MSAPSPRIVWALAGLALVTGLGFGYGFGRVPAPAVVAAAPAPELGLDAVFKVLNQPAMMLDILGGKVEDPLKIATLAHHYGVAAERGAVEERLKSVYWGPATHPAPFVGHMAREAHGNDLSINALGFRDHRTSYDAKPPGIIRVFVTGGSTAWGTGAPSSSETIPALLERALDSKRVQVVNAAFPAWSTTQEKLLIDQKLTSLSPDVIVMLSGNNDVHWAAVKQDIRWFYSYMDQNQLAIINQVYTRTGHPDWVMPVPVLAERPNCDAVAAMTVANVRQAALAANAAKARLVFALQPNVYSMAKPMTPYEFATYRDRDVDYRRACYASLRRDLASLKVDGFSFVDLSDVFDELPPDTEIFLDAYHVAGRGAKIIADALSKRIAWP